MQIRLMRHPLKIKKRQGLLSVQNAELKTILMQNIASTAERKLHKKENALIADRFLMKVRNTARNAEEK